MCEEARGCVHSLILLLLLPFMACVCIYEGRRRERGRERERERLSTEPRTLKHGSLASQPDEGISGPAFHALVLQRSCQVHLALMQTTGNLNQVCTLSQQTPYPRSQSSAIGSLIAHGTHLSAGMASPLSTQGAPVSASPGLSILSSGTEEAMALH